MKNLTIESAKKQASKIILSLEGKIQKRVMQKAYDKINNIVKEMRSIGEYADVEISKDYAGELTLRTSLSKTYAYKINNDIIRLA